MTHHRQLLADYAEQGSEDAFRELVTLYLGLVHASAVRLTDGDTHRAQDIAQTVFADLARLARTVPTEATLGGWLHRRTCHVAATLMRSERRRQDRERHAVEMNALHESPDEALAQVAPVLDDAINQLNTDDREAIMLRFFERSDLRTIGDALGSNEDAAQKRIARALEKLRHLLARRGVVLSATALTLALGSEAAVAAPVGMAVSVSTTALTATHASSGLFTTLKILIMTKLKITALAALSVALAAGVGTTVVLMKREKDYAADYTPPAHIAMQQVLSDAQADTSAGRYKEALAKHVWFQENALKYEPNMVGVRSSFALMNFGQLAEKYPPAKEKLKSMRDKAAKIVHDTGVDRKTGGGAFGEFSTINRSFHEEKKTVEAFVWLDAHNPTLAKAVYPFAEPDLLKNEEYKLCGQYLDPAQSFQLMVQVRNGMTRNSAKTNSNPIIRDTANKMFSNRAATMVAILAMNNRQSEADVFAARAAQEWNDPGFKSQLDEARNGTAPASWP